MRAPARSPRETATTVFVCQECGAQSAEVARPLRRLRRVELVRRGAPAEAAPGAGGAAHRYALAGAAAAARLYADIETSTSGARLSTGIDEFDRVLGGGIVPGSLVLLGGEPGIGKSTLLLQAAANIARHVGPVLYSSGEESEHQIKSRGERLGVGDAPLYLLAETCLERILEEIARLKPALVIVDSIQTVFSLKFQSAPGSIGQVREAATQLLFAAKGQNVPIVPRRPRHQGRQPRRAEGARARRRHGALLRGRAAPRAPRRAGGQEPVRRRQRTRRLRDDRPRACGPCPTRRSCSWPSGRPAAPGRRCSAAVEGSRPILVEVQALVSTQHLRQRAAHGHRPRPAPAVAAAGRAREARRPQPRRRRRVREHRRRHERRRTGRRPGAWSPRSPRASATAPCRAGTAMFGEVGLAGEVRGVTQAGAAGPGGGADGLHALRDAGGQRRSDRSRGWPTPASWSGSEPSGRRSTHLLA